MKFLLAVLALCATTSAFRIGKLNTGSLVTSSMRSTATTRGSSLRMNDKKDGSEDDNLNGWDRLMKQLSEAENDEKRLPPIYVPGAYSNQALAALAYLIPIVDASDLGKYMFEAYPEVGSLYNTVFGPVAAIYNGVPFLPFAVFFGMSYICRAPNFPVEVRFHWSQAFMLSLIQFIPSLAFPFLEKAGVPGMGIGFNTVFMWVMISSLMMQALLLNPLSQSKNPLHINVVGWAMRYMNYTPDMVPK